VANGVASVATGDFRQGRFGNISRTTGSQIHEAGLVRGQLPVAPTAASLRYSNRALAGVPRSSENIHFFGRSTPSPVQRVPFAEQQRAMQQFSRQAPVVTASRGATGGATVGAGQSRGATPGGAWRPVNESSQAAGAARGAGGSSGWQRFGEPRPSGSNAAAANGYRSYATYAPSSGSRPQSIRVAPPVVREKSQSASRSQSSGRSSSGGSAHGGGGGGAHGGVGGGHR
jgi:hypothetical protein